MAPPLGHRSDSREVGRYRTFDALAAGGMATVHLGVLLGEAGFVRAVAIKRLHPHLASDLEFCTMFLDEARLASRVRHPNVVATLDLVRDEDALAVVMEYVHGLTLSQLAHAAAARSERIALDVVSAIMVGALEGLHAAHEATTETGEPLDLVHRDVSPQNIMVGTDGIARVLDFGVAKASARLRTTVDGKVRGKFAYMAPEQLQGQLVTRQTDVYAAGVVLWELVTGQRLHQADNEAEIVTRILANQVARPAEICDVPATLDGIIMRALKPAPTQRWATAHELADAIRSVVPPASARDVGAWVNELGSSMLRDRATLVRSVERAAASGSGDVPRRQVTAPPDAPTTPLLRSAVQPRSEPEATTGHLSTSVSAVARALRPRPRLALMAGLGSLTIALGYWVVAGSRGGAEAHSASAARGSPPVPGPASAAPSTPTSVPAVTSSRTDPNAKVTPGAVSGSPLSAPSPLAGAPRPASARPPQPPRASCSPPYVVDGKGHKHFKIECL